MHGIIIIIIYYYTLHQGADSLILENGAPAKESGSLGDPCDQQIPREQTNVRGQPNNRKMSLASSRSFMFKINTNSHSQPGPEHRLVNTPA